MLRLRALLIVTLICLFVNTAARADYGNVWVTNATSTSITISCSNPTPPLAYASSPALFKVCWKQTPFLFGPCIGGTSVTTNTMPYTVVGLQPNVPYNIKVEGYTKKWAWVPISWGWHYTWFRDVGSITTKTLSQGAGLQPTAASYDGLDFNVLLDSPLAWSMVRVGYKRVGSLVSLNLTCQQLNGPANNWGSSDSNRGWLDFSNPQSTSFPISFFDLDCGDKYVVRLYGFTSGSNNGIELDAVAIKTLGNWWICGSMQSALYPQQQIAGSLFVSDNEESFAQYAALIEAHYSGETVSLCTNDGDTDCCKPHRGVGCTNNSCQRNVCSLDPFCCESGWDEACTELAQAVCVSKVAPVDALIQDLDTKFPGIAALVADTLSSLDDVGVYEEYMGQSVFHLLSWLLTDYQDGALFWQWQLSDPTLPKNLLLSNYLAEFHPELLEEASGIANPLPGDINGDGLINAADLSLLLGAWGRGGGPADLNSDGAVGAPDLGILLGNWTPAATP